MGRDLRRLLREHLGMLANVSFGSIYPALARLEKAGAAVAAGRHSPARGRRDRKVYRITNSGRQLFAELLAGGSAAEDARSFTLRVAFARHLEPQARLSLLERRRAVLVQRLAETEREVAHAELDVYARSVVQHTADGVARDITWLDGLITSEHAQLVAAGPEPST